MFPNLNDMYVCEARKCRAVLRSPAYIHLEQVTNGGLENNHATTRTRRNYFLMTPTLIRREHVLSLHMIASYGIGYTYVLLMKRFGARVTITVGSCMKLRLVCTMMALQHSRLAAHRAVFFFKSCTRVAVAEGDPAAVPVHIYI